MEERSKAEIVAEKIARAAGLPGRCPPITEAERARWRRLGWASENPALIDALMSGEMVAVPKKNILTHIASLVQRGYRDEAEREAKWLDEQIAASRPTATATERGT